MEHGFRAELCGYHADSTQSWKQTTIQTFFERLCDKGVLDVRKEGKTNFYSARISEDEYKKESRRRSFSMKRIRVRLAKSLLTALFGANVSHKDKKELEEIKEWLRGNLMVTL